MKATQKRAATRAVAGWETVAISPAASEALHRLKRLRRAGPRTPARRLVVSDMLHWTQSLPDDVAAFFANDCWYAGALEDGQGRRDYLVGRSFDFYQGRPLHNLLCVASALSPEGIAGLLDAAYELLLQPSRAEKPATEG
jgi:hypothetical protein